MKTNYLFAVIGVFLAINILSYGCTKKVVKEETVVEPPPVVTAEEEARRKAEEDARMKEGALKEEARRKAEEDARMKEKATLLSPKDEISLMVEREGRLLPIYFDFDRFTIREDVRPILERNASWLKKNLAIKVQVQGHADERGSDEYNLALGERRTQSARGYLVNLGIDSSRLSTISYGEERPADPGHNEEAWGKNRRVEFVIVK